MMKMISLGSEALSKLVLAVALIYLQSPQYSFNHKIHPWMQRIFSKLDIIHFALTVNGLARSQIEMKISSGETYDGKSVFLAFVLQTAVDAGT